MKTALVTGGTGFLGSNLAIALLREGYRVRILRRPSSDLRAIGDADVEHCLGDVRDPAAVLGAVKGCDTVFHTAAMVSYWRRERQEMFDVNIGGTWNVVHACLAAGVRRLVHTSSIAAVGFSEDGVPVDETCPFNWGSSDVGYRISKRESEAIVLQAARRGLPAVVVNPSLIIGPRDVHFNAGQIIRDVYRRRIFYYVGGGTNVVDVDDVVRGHIAAAHRGRIRERYLLTGENLTHREILSITADVVGGIRPLLWFPMPVARGIALISEGMGNLLNRRPWMPIELVRGLDRVCWYSSAKAERELGFTVTTFRESIRKTFVWYRENGFLT